MKQIVAQLMANLKAISNLKGISTAATMVALLLVSAGCATHTAMYNAPSKQALVTEAGFRTIPANTSRRQAILRMLPPDSVSYVRRNGRDWYVLPDLANNQLFVGTRPQYDTYRQLVMQNRLAMENYQAATWSAPADWGAWGAWGWGGTRFGYVTY